MNQLQSALPALQYTVYTHQGDAHSQPLQAPAQYPTPITPYPTNTTPYPVTPTPHPNNPTQNPTAPTQYPVGPTPPTTPQTIVYQPNFYPQNPPQNLPQTQLQTSNPQDQVLPAFPNQPAVLYYPPQAQPGLQAIPTGPSATQVLQPNAGTMTSAATMSGQYTQRAVTSQRRSSIPLQLGSFVVDASRSQARSKPAHAPTSQSRDAKRILDDVTAQDNAIIAIATAGDVSNKENRARIDTKALLNTSGPRRKFLDKMGQVATGQNGKVNKRIQSIVLGNNKRQNYTNNRATTGSTQSVDTQKPASATASANDEVKPETRSRSNEGQRRVLRRGQIARSGGEVEGTVKQNTAQDKSCTRLYSEVLSSGKQLKSSGTASAVDCSTDATDRIQDTVTSSEHASTQSCDTQRPKNAKNSKNSGHKMVKNRKNPPATSLLSDATNISQSEDISPAQHTPLRPIPKRFLELFHAEACKDPVANWVHFTGQALKRTKPIGSKKRKEAMEAEKRRAHEARMRCAAMYDHIHTPSSIQAFQLNPEAQEFQPSSPMQKSCDSPGYDSGYSGNHTPTSMTPPPECDNVKSDSENVSNNSENVSNNSENVSNNSDKVDSDESECNISSIEGQDDEEIFTEKLEEICENSDTEIREDMEHFLESAECNAPRDCLKTQDEPSTSFEDATRLQSVIQGSVTSQNVTSAPEIPWQPVFPVNTAPAPLVHFIQHALGSSNVPVLTANPCDVSLIGNAYTQPMDGSQPLVYCNAVPCAPVMPQQAPTQQYFVYAVPPGQQQVVALPTTQAGVQQGYPNTC